jgi:hypothetical protein
VFVPGKHFQPGLMFVGKARAYLAGGTFQVLYLGRLRSKSQRQERLARYKHKLVLTFINYSFKKFYNIGPWLNIGS